jgi:hypothetical protein
MKQMSSTSHFSTMHLNPQMSHRTPEKKDSVENLGLSQIGLYIQEAHIPLF